MPPRTPTNRAVEKRAPNTELEHSSLHDETRSTNMLTPPNIGPSEISGTDIKLSRKRWFVLFAIAILGLSISVAGDTSSVFNLLLNLLDLKVDQYIYISQIYHYLTLVLMAPTAIFVDKFGIRTATHAAVILFILNGLFKVLLYFTRLPGWAAYKMTYYLTSCFFGTWTYLLFIVLPLKVSETWFSISERSVAWTILTLQYDLGQLFASFLYPRLINKVDDFKVLAYVWIVAVATSTVSCVACVTRSEPDHPPSARMAEASKDLKTPLFISIKKMLKHKDILLHVVHGGVYGSLLYALGIVLQDIMVSIGLSPIFVGNYMSVNAIVAIIMLLSLSGFVHKVKNPLLACKLGSFAQSALFMALLVSLRMAAPGWIILLVAVACTICKSFTSPHFNNITAHMACGTVSQATIVGFSVTIGTVLMSIVQVAFAYLIDNNHPETKYSKSLLLMGVICVINEALYLLFFQGRTVSKIATTTDEQAVHNPAHEHTDPEAR